MKSLAEQSAWDESDLLKRTHQNRRGNHRAGAAQAGGKAVGQGGEQLRAEDGEPGVPMGGDGHRMLLSEKGPPLPSGRRTGAGFFL